MTSRDNSSGGGASPRSAVALATNRSEVTPAETPWSEPWKGIPAPAASANPEVEGSFARAAAPPAEKAAETFPIAIDDGPVNAALNGTSAPASISVGASNDADSAGWPRARSGADAWTTPVCGPSVHRTATSIDVSPPAADRSESSDAVGEIV